MKTSAENLHVDVRLKKFFITVGSFYRKLMNCWVEVWPRRMKMQCYKNWKKWQRLYSWTSLFRTRFPNTSLFWTQMDFPWSVFSVIYYRLFRTPAISNCFSFPLRVRNSRGQLYIRDLISVISNWRGQGQNSVSIWFGFFFFSICSKITVFSHTGLFSCWLHCPTFSPLVCTLFSRKNACKKLSFSWQHRLERKNWVFLHTFFLKSEAQTRGENARHWSQMKTHPSAKKQ